ncbi:Glyoxylase, beta-lactamase superfamily II [Pseudonocardia ammonioxydans]|uniref:Glyoxylase, beta-lactamase superfamily II n=1 Tax=Pseudonocardia ammonioxydans TaxID=260086 RepID=A0A1I5C9F0_PSUAM|nr:MBL fold metallo-hydrolase [Pseudonocardia ammonioxydans]SFN83643.1 Glyoxylase, beta-lactamase superfamily II [Pseudonocardia ammonioxydans]
MAQPAPSRTITVGDIAITYLPDGEGHFDPVGMFPASDEAAWSRHAQWLDDDGRVVATIGAYLIRTGDRTILVDLGFGTAEVDIPGFARAESGRMLESLAAEGLTPADVDTVLYTHLHADHTGWTAGEDGLTFTHAAHLVGDEAEVAFWRANPEAPFAPPVATVLDPLSPRLEFCRDGQTVAPGVTVRATPGHTPGHQSVVVSSGAERAVLLGDVAHCPAQLLEPEWAVLFDVDPDTARRTRERLLDELEGTGTPVGCCHFPEAAFGRIVRGEGTRYWTPL